MQHIRNVFGDDCGRIIQEMVTESQLKESFGEVQELPEYELCAADDQDRIQECINHLQCNLACGMLYMTHQCLDAIATPNLLSSGDATRDQRFVVDFLKSQFRLRFASILRNENYKSWNRFCKLSVRGGVNIQAGIDATLDIAFAEFKIEFTS